MGTVIDTAAMHNNAAATPTQFIFSNNFGWGKSATMGIINSTLRLVDILLDHWQGNYAERKNPYLLGNFGPVSDELFSPNLVPKIGYLPMDLKGEFVRNGPNPKHIPKGGYHWFDGDGMLHSIRLTGSNNCTYVNRYTRTKRFLEEEKAHRALYLRIGEIYGKLGILKVFYARFKGLLLGGSKRGDGTANTALVYHDRRVMALVENDHPYMVKILLDGHFETLGRYSYEGKLNHPFSAHPKVCPITQEMITFGYQLDKKPFLQVSVISKEGQLLRTVDAAIPKPAMIHDMAITSTKNILLDLPLNFVPENMAKGDGYPFVFNKHQNSRIGVADRHSSATSDYKWFNFQPGFGFHTINAFDHGDEVYVMLCRSEQFRLGPQLVLESEKKRWLPYPHVFRMNLKTGETAERRISDIAGEFPVVNPAKVGINSRFCYMATMAPDLSEPLFNGVVKFDLSEIVADGNLKEIGRIQYGSKKYGGECVYVPRSGSVEEDDGYLLTFVFNEDIDKSELWVMDARTMSSDPIAVVELPQRVPYGFHGLFVNEQQLVEQRDSI